MTERLQHALDDWRAGANAPAAAAAVRLNGSLLWAGVSRDDDRPDASPLSSRSRFCIYSITKTFTAVCVLRLEAEGRLSIRDPVHRWFSDLPVPPTVQLSHLLQHTSGIRDYGPLPRYHDDVRTRPSAPWTDREFLDATVARGPLFEPGAGWSYSNPGYLLLRRIVERVTGGSFRECVHRQVVRPLGLSDTFIAETIDDWSSCVPGYGREVRSDGREVDVRLTYHPDWCAPGVGVSTVEDITRFYDGLLSGETLDRDRLDKMLRLVHVPGSHPPAVSPSAGMGILGDPDGPFGPSYGHGGGGPGYSLSASILPRRIEGRLAIAVFCNSSSAHAQEGEHALLRAATRGDPGGALLL